MAIETVSSTVAVDNPPTSLSLIDEVDATDLSLRGLVAGTGVSLLLDTSNGESKIVINMDATTAQNVGGGIALYKEQIGGSLQFRTLVAGDNVRLTQQADTIRVEVDETLFGVNRGLGGEEVFAGKVGNELQFRRLRAGTSVHISATSDALTINALTGERNSGVSLGDPDDGGFEIYAGMDGEKLRFKKLFAGANIRLLDNGCGIMIAAAVPALTGSGVIEGINLGTGAPVYAGRDVSLLRFRSIVGRGGTIISQTADEIVIDGSNASSNATNVGSGAGVFRNKNGGTLELRSLLAGVGINIDADDNELVISADATLGEPSSGSYADPLVPGGPAPAFPGWTANTKIADALDQLNKLLGTIVNA